MDCVLLIVSIIFISKKIFGDQKLNYRNFAYKINLRVIFREYVFKCFNKLNLIKISSFTYCRGLQTQHKTKKKVFRSFYGVVVR